MQPPPKKLLDRVRDAIRVKIRGRDSPRGLPLPFRTVHETFTSYGS